MGDIEEDQDEYVEEEDLVMEETSTLNENDTQNINIKSEMNNEKSTSSKIKNELEESSPKLTQEEDEEDPLLAGLNRLQKQSYESSKISPLSELKYSSSSAAYIPSDPLV